MDLRLGNGPSPSSLPALDCTGRQKMEGNPMVPERRKESRKTPTEFTFIQLEQEFSGRVLNISVDGLCFETLSPINATPLIQFWFSYHTQGEVDGVGRVVWLNQKKNLGVIRFVH